ncbi:hypothetical protein THII_3878 [Thioploca ingrica]|uniref:Uncharacterized protein n=1 Tax=Thioploca ingrica TaxID=40754 RepID=A0A090AR09_9GAMM|nr:hypothetical protein THII_3878 [Thioploca ingrica]
MDEFERILRWAWYIDYGETPEQTIERIKNIFSPSCSPCNLSTSHFRISLTEMLTQFRNDILQQGQNHNIDSRAIVGAIAWEYEENFAGRLSDYLQYMSFSSYRCKGTLFGQGLGWGSIHTDTAQKFRPHSRPFELQCLRLEAVSAIELVAEIMDDVATQYYKLSGGIWIRDSPAVLALFFNTGEKLLSQSAAKHKLNLCKPNQVITLTISQNQMATWVNANLERFAEFKTPPIPPKEHYATIVVQ